MNQSVVETVQARSRGVCERCGVRRAQVLHHRVFRSRGGPDTPANLSHLCDLPGWSCHRTVHDRNEWPWVLPGFFVRGVFTGPDDARDLLEAS